MLRRAGSLAACIAFACAALAFAVGPVCALSATDLCFYAPFDGSLDAVYAAGEAKPRKVTGEFAFVPGVSGKAVVAGEPGKELAYAIEGNLPGRKGAISIWIKTIDWSAGDFKGHSIIGVPGKFQFYHASHSGGVHLEWLEQWGGSTYNYPQGPAKGEWKHLVYTWGDGGITLYQNGQFVSRIELTNRIYFPTSPKEFPELVGDLLFHVCDPSLTADGKNAALVDELMMFNRPLTAVEVKSLYRGAAVQSQEVLETVRTGAVVASLSSAGPNELFRGSVIRLPETVARIGLAKAPPVLDGKIGSGEWAGSAEFCDFTDVPFGNLTTRAVRANVSYDNDALHVCVRSGGVPRPETVFDLAMISLRRSADGPIHRIVKPVDGDPWRTVNDAVEKTSSRAAVGESRGTRCFEFAIPWTEIGASPPKTGESVYLSVLRNWSSAYGDQVTWPVEMGGASESASFARLVFGGDRPVLALERLGKLNYAQLQLSAKASGKKGGALRGMMAEIRLQPADLREYWDPKTLPGTKSYTGARMLLDAPVRVKVAGFPAVVSQWATFSDTDLDSLWLKVTDASGDIVYQAQRSFVPQPPITVSVKTYPDHNRLQIEADVSQYRESGLDTINAEIALVGPKGTVIKTASISSFKSTREAVNLALKPLPAGKIKVKATLRRGKAWVSEFAASFEKLGPKPWVGNKLGKDDIVIAPFTPVKVNGQRVSVWGRTYVWKDSLFPVQVTSGGQDLLAGPIELSSGGAGGKPNRATVKVIEQKPTRVILEATGAVAGVPVKARHVIEYDGMVLTTLKLSPKSRSRLGSLSLVISYKREHSTLYSMTPEPMSGAVRETVNNVYPPMNGKMDATFKHSVWLGDEERGMTWFAEHGKGWRFKNNLTPVGVEAQSDRTLLTLRFAAAPFDVEGPAYLTFGIIATPVKPMRDNWRFLRNQRDWTYRWYGVFTAANNDIAHPFPSFKQYQAEQHKSVPILVPYQMPVYANVRQPEVTYYGEEWMFPPRQLIGNDQGDEERHIGVCLGSNWQDFFVYYAVKAYDDLHLDGYYLDGGIPDVRGCTNALHNHGWRDDSGVLHGTYDLLAHRELFKRLAVEFYKRHRPYLLFVHLSGCVEMPTFSFADMGWNGEQFSTTAVPARDYNKLLTLPYFRAQFLGQQFGIPIQLLLEYWKREGSEPIGTAQIDTALGLSLVHGVADNMMAGNFAEMANWEYAKTVVTAQDSFGIREKDCEFLPYWNNQDLLTVEPSDDNLVCSAWKRPGKILLVLNNSTPSDQQAVIHLNLAALGFAGGVEAADLITGQAEPVEGAAVRADVKKSSWRLIVVNTTQ